MCHHLLIVIIAKIFIYMNFILVRMRVNIMKAFIGHFCLWFLSALSAIKMVCKIKYDGHWRERERDRDAGQRTILVSRNCKRLRFCFYIYAKLWTDMVKFQLKWTHYNRFKNGLHAIKHVWSAANERKQNAKRWKKKKKSHWTMDTIASSTTLVNKKNIQQQQPKQRRINVNIIMRITMCTSSWNI